MMTMMLTLMMIPSEIDPSEAPAENPGPTPAQHKAGLRAIIDEEITRLSELVAQFEAEADETDDEHEGDEQDQLAFDDSPEGDRLHRYQAHWSRSLLRTIEAIARLKKRGDGGEQGDAEGEPDEPPMQVPPLIDSAPSKPDSTRGAMQRGPNPSLALRAHDPSKPDSTRGAMQRGPNPSLALRAHDAPNPIQRAGPCNVDPTRR